VASSPEQQACAAALEHGDEVRGDALAGIDTKGLVPQRVERCVNEHWPASFLQCLATAANGNAEAACYTALPAADRDRIMNMSALCGDHPFQLRLAIPQMRFEALKLVNALDNDHKRDCRAITSGPVDTVAIGPGSHDRGKRDAMACFETPPGSDGGGCTTVDVETGGFGANDGPSSACVGPFTANAPDYAWKAPGGCPFDLQTVVP